MNRYTNAHLEHYADRFIALRLARHGVSLEQYLANVERFERLALEPEPPLPAQQAAILRLWAEQDAGLASLGGDSEPAPLPDNHQDWRELLARWRLETEAAERPLAHLPQRNGAVIEPLRHHCHSHARSARCFFNKRGA